MAIAIISTASAYLNLISNIIQFDLIANIIQFDLIYNLNLI